MEESQINPNSYQKSVQKYFSIYSSTSTEYFLIFSVEEKVH